MSEKTGYKAVSKFLIASPTKVRPVANVVKRKTCSEAMAILENMPQKGAELIRETLKSAIANALYANKQLDEDMLYVKDVNASLAGLGKYSFISPAYLNYLKEYGIIIKIR